MSYINPGYPNSFYLKNSDVNFHFPIDEKDAKSILRQLKKLNIKYDKFLDCSLYKLYIRIFYSEMDSMQQIMPERITHHFSNVMNNSLPSRYNDQKALEIFRKSILDIESLDNSKLKRLDLSLNKLASLSLLTKIEFRDLKISSIKKLAYEPININKNNYLNKGKNSLYCLVIPLKILLTSHTSIFNSLITKPHEHYCKLLEIFKQKLSYYNSTKQKITENDITVHDIVNKAINLEKNDAIISLLKAMLISDKKNKLKLIDQIIEITSKDLDEHKKIFNQLILLTKEITKFFTSNKIELDFVVNNFDNEFILYNIKKIILDLGKNNIFRQKKPEILGKGYNPNIFKVYEDIFSKLFYVAKLVGLDENLQKCLNAVHKLSKDIDQPKEFPEFSFLKADNNKKIFNSKKQTADLNNDSDNIDLKDFNELLEVKQELKHTNISLDSVERSLVNVIKKRNEEDFSFSIIHKFDYLFRLKADSKYAKEANAIGHFKACDLRLFIDALLKTDIEALGTIIPMLFLNLAAQTEQKSKSSKLIIEKHIANSHSLNELLEDTGNLQEKFKTYIHDFNLALVWMRYLEHSSDMYKNSTSMPQSLKWAEECIQLMQEIRNKRVQLDTNLEKKLLQLVDFVFESNIQSYIFLAEGSKELSPLLNHWREYLGVIKNQIIESLKAKKNQYIECRALEINHPIIILETMMKESNDNTLNLKEAIQHLYRMDASKRLMSKYNDPILNPWFERNMISPWAIEALLKSMINKKGYFDPISSHDFDTLIECFEQLNIGDKPVIFKNRDKLSELNIGIAHHYPVSHAWKMDEKQTLFKDYLDMILSFPQHLTLTEKEKKRNRVDSERLVRALLLSQEVIKDIVDNYVQINK